MPGRIQFARIGACARILVALDLIAVLICGTVMGQKKFYTSTRSLRTAGEFAEKLCYSVLIRHDYEEALGLFDLEQTASLKFRSGEIDERSPEKAGHILVETWQALVEQGRKAGRCKGCQSLSDVLSPELTRQNSELKSRILALNKEEPRRQWFVSTLFRITNVSKHAAEEIGKTTGDLYFVLTNYELKDGTRMPLGLLLREEKGKWKAIDFVVLND